MTKTTMTVLGITSATAIVLYAAGCGSGGGGSSSSLLPNATPTPIPSPTFTPSPTPTPSPGATATPTATPTPTPSPTATPIASPAVVNINVVADPGNTLAMGFAFSNQPSVVHPGDSVEWVDTTPSPHGITWDFQTPSTSPGPGANIPIFQPGTTSQAWVAPNVTQVTTYNYHCTVHGIYMNNVINVTPNP